MVVSCGGHDVHNFLERTARNAAYTSHVAVAEFIEALGTRVEESLLKHLCQASCFSIMADECTYIDIMEEMSVFCQWEEDGTQRSIRWELIHQKQANAESICSAIFDCLKEKDLQVSKLLEWVLVGQHIFKKEDWGPD